MVEFLDLSCNNLTSIPDWVFKLENLKYTGFISKEKVEFYLSKSKYLICTSKSYEGFPNIILEAWKNQTIPIVPDYPTYNSIVRENGIIYKNYEDLILKMKNIESMEIKLNFKELNDLYSKQSALELLRKNNLLEISS